MEKKYSVLFVDDEEKILRSLERGLFDENYNCIFAESGMRALTIMETQEIHVIVSDMRMPVMNGLELLKKVEEKYPDTVKIILSGYTQLQQILTTINQVDIFKFITKPWDLEGEFKGVIKKAIAYYKLREDNTNMKKDLQLKNKAYLNILQNIDDKVSTSKLAAGIVNAFSTATHNFNCNLDMNPDLDVPYVFEFQKRSYEALSKNLHCEEKELKSEEFVISILNQIQAEKKLNILSFSNKIAYKGHISIHDQVAKTILSCAVTTFIEDIASPGIYAAAWDGADSKLSISVFFPLMQPQSKKGVSTGIMNLHLKQSFLNSALAGAASASNMSFQAVRRENYMVFQLEIPYKTQSEDSTKSSS